MKKPQEIKAYLDKYVIGHEKTKKHLAVAGYNHYKRIKGEKIGKTNVLIIGASGTGKTYMVSKLSEFLEIPFITVDSTQLTASGYEGRSVENIITELVVLCENNEKKAEKSIIYLDEVDKLRKKNTSNDVNGLAVQQALLKMIEGTDVAYTSGDMMGGEYSQKLNTRNILFIGSGAFSDLEKVDVDSLIQYGLIPEFLGRFSVISQLQELTLEDYKKILTDSKDSVLISFKDWFKSENIELEVTDDAIEILAQTAINGKIGARGLQKVLEETLIEAQYEAPGFYKDFKPTKLLLDGDSIASKNPKWIFNKVLGRQ